MRYRRQDGAYRSALLRLSQEDCGISDITGRLVLQMDTIDRTRYCRRQIGARADAVILGFDGELDLKHTKWSHCPVGTQSGSTTHLRSFAPSHRDLFFQ